MKKSFRSPLVGASVGAGLKTIEDFLALKLGNIVLTMLPPDKNEARKVVEFCRDNKIYMVHAEIVRRENHKRWYSEGLSKDDFAELFSIAGEYFLGRYVIGEAGGICYWPKGYIIDAAVGAWRALPPCRNDEEAGRAFVDYLKGELKFERENIAPGPFFNVESSILFARQSEAGVDAQCIELLPGDPFITLSAIRGTAKAFNTIWGAHIAMLWYGGVQVDELWQKRWKMSLYTSFMAGADFIYPESAHLEYRAPGMKEYKFGDAEIVRVRAELRELYAFSQIHDRPDGALNVPCAIVQGRDDGHPGIWNPYAWGQVENGTEWETSDHERGWELFDALFKREDLFHENVTGSHHCSGNPPSGQIDIVPPEADFSAYRTLFFVGVNRMDEELYKKLTGFVERGGHLVIWLSHFDNSETRGDAVKLFNNGDLSELCGFKVSGSYPSDVCGMKFICRSSFKEYDFPVRHIARDPFFIGRIEGAKIEDTSNGALKVIAALGDVPFDTVESLSARPLLVEHRVGRGAVFTVTAFTPPGAAGVRKFGELLMRTVARGSRRVFDLITPDTMRYAIYGDEKFSTVYMFNCDPDLSGSIRAVYKERLSGEIVTSACSFNFFCFADGVLLMPQNSFCNIKKISEDDFSVETTPQKIFLENISGVERKITINGTEVNLMPGNRTALDLSSSIPDEKAQFFAADYLQEPPIVMSNTSTPY